MWSLSNDEGILYDGHGIIVPKALYVGHTIDIDRRLYQHSRDKDWFYKVDQIDVECYTGDKSDVLGRERYQISTLNPHYNTMSKKDPSMVPFLPPATVVAKGIVTTLAIKYGSQVVEQGAIHTYRGAKHLRKKLKSAYRQRQRNRIARNPQELQTLIEISNLNLTSKELEHAEAST